MTPDHLVKVTAYLTDRSQAAINGEVRRQYLGAREPVFTVIIGKLGESYMNMIDIRFDVTRWEHEPIIVHDVIYDELCCGIVSAE